jgi:hypothetical protein
MITIDAEGTYKGIFFRLPIQKVMLSEQRGECSYWLKKAKRWVIPMLLNWKKYKQMPEWMEEDDYYGCLVRVFASPIYFERTVRTAFHKFEFSNTVDKIEVFGEEPYKNDCAGNCILEKAVFFFKDKSKKVVKTPGKFKYYYAHILEKEIPDKGSE